VPLTIEEHTHLAPHTTLGVGGQALYLARCRSVEEVREALEWGRHRHLPVQILGGGSNTVFSDRGYAGLVLKMETRGVEVSPGSVPVGQGPDRAAAAPATAAVTAAAGEDWDAFVEGCIARHLGGLECLSGIPGLVGATPIQNVGAYGQEVAGTIASVRALARDTLEEVELVHGDCDFGYRQSRFKGRDRGRYVITEVTFRLPVAVPPQVCYPELQRHLEGRADLADLPPGQELSTAVRRAVLELRRRKSMVVDPADAESRSVGSFFLNPVLAVGQFAELEDRWQREGDGSAVPSYDEVGGARKVPAGWLVERAGFHKGMRRGGAAISSHHALALVQCGGGAEDILSLAADIQRAVAQRFGLHLEREPEVVAYDPAPPPPQGGE